MPSNQIPEDVRAECEAMIELVTIVPASLARTDAQEHEVVNDLVDAIAPLIIEWARKDQAEVDAQRAMLCDPVEVALSGARYVAEAIRAQFETEGKP